MADENSSDAKRKKGRHAYVATDDARRLVHDLIARHAHHADIAAALGISVPTLRKYFAAELRDRLGPANLFTGPAASEATAAPPALPQAPRPGPRAPRKAGRSGGRPPHVPTRESRERVAELIAAGFRVEAVARVLEISEPTLRRAYAAEIETGAQVKRAEIVRELFRSARKGNVAAQKAALDMMDRAELERAEARLSDAGQPVREGKPKPDTPGKKAQAALDAVDAATSGSWADLLPTPPPAPRAH